MKHTVKANIIFFSNRCWGSGRHCVCVRVCVLHTSFMQIYIGHLLQCLNLTNKFLFRSFDTLLYFLSVFARFFSVRVEVCCSCSCSSRFSSSKIKTNDSLSLDSRANNKQNNDKRWNIFEIRISVSIISSNNKNAVLYLQYMKVILIQRCKHHI